METTYVVAFDGPEPRDFGVYGPFDTVEDSENWAEGPDGPASRGSAWYSVGILDPSMYKSSR